MFWERFSELCNTNSISANAVCSKLGLSTATATHWKNGTMPKGDILGKVADYFNVTVDYLLGRTNSTTEINSHNTISGNNNIIGNGNSVGEKLSEQEAALLEIFRKVDVIKRAQLIAYAAELEKRGVSI